MYMCPNQWIYLKLNEGKVLLRVFLQLAIIIMIINLIRLDGIKYAIVLNLLIMMLNIILDKTRILRDNGNKYF